MVHPGNVITHPFSRAQAQSGASIFDKCSRYNRAQQLIDAGLYPYFHALYSGQDPEVVCHNRSMIMMSSNNYLGLNTHPVVRQAAVDATLRYGTGCSGSRFLNGTLFLHEELEVRLAAFLKQEAALLFPTGFQANLGAVSALVGKNDCVVIDRMDHASIYDGSQLAFGKVRKFHHNDTEDLARVLRECQGTRSALVIVDGVFSMEGDVADLPDIARLCQAHDAGLMVDDAHGLGVLGRHGRGTAEHFGLEHKVDLLMGTFSKSLASIGGYLAGSKQLIEYLKHHARPLIFSASLPPASVAAAMAALDVMEREPSRRERLWHNARYFREGLEALGFDTGISQTPIIPVLIGDEQKTLKMWRILFDLGVFTSPILSPAVPRDMTLIRTSCMASHTLHQLERVLDAFEKAGRQLHLI